MILVPIQPMYLAAAYSSVRRILYFSGAITAGMRYRGYTSQCQCGHDLSEPEMPKGASGPGQLSW